MREIYVDHAATTNMKREVLDYMMPYLTSKYGNASSVYPLGIQNRKAIDESRSKIKNAIGAKSQEEIIFTSGGSEADNLAIKGIANARKKYGKHIITSNIEHGAVINTCKALENEGFEVSFASVDKNGFINVKELEKIIRSDTILVSIMMVNNEIGTIQPIKEISKITRKRNIVFHTDAVQAVGSLKIDVQDLGVDLLSMSAHKFYGPKGMGALYIKEGTKIAPQILGGHQEFEKRAGTENVPRNSWNG